MKKLLFLFLLASFGAQSQPLVKAVVSSVFDGDGCRVRFSQKEKTTEVRFRYIDAPECRGYSVRAQPYGNISRDSLRAWIDDRQILLDTSNVNGKSRDIYGRLLAVPYFAADSSSITFSLVDSGLAWFIPSRFGNREQKRLLRNAMADAKADKRGLWLSYLLGDGNTARVVKPETWRKKFSFRAFWKK